MTTTTTSKAACGHPASFHYLTMRSRLLCAYCAMIAKAK